MPKAITIFESDDGHRFESLAACEQYEANNRAIHLQRLRDEIGYREVPLFEERRYGAYLVSPVTILTATPRSMKELEEIAEYMRTEISPNLKIMPGFRINPETLKPYYAEPAAFPMIYSVMIERYRKRKYPIVKLFTGREFGKLANLITGHVAPDDISNGSFDDETGPVTNSYIPSGPTEVPDPIPGKQVVIKGFAGDDTGDPPAKKTWSRRPKSYTYNGKTMTTSEWAKELKMNTWLIHDRIHRRGWTVEQAFSTPVRSHKVHEIT